MRACNKITYKLLDRQTFYEIVAQKVLSNRFLKQNTSWTKASFLSLVTQFQGSHMQTVANVLCDMRFCKIKPKEFTILSRIVCVKKKTRSCWVYIQDLNKIAYYQKILNQFTSRCKEKIKTMHFDFRKAQFVLEDKAMSVLQYVDAADNMKAQIHCTFTFECRNNYIVPTLCKIYEINYD